MNKMKSKSQLDEKNVQKLIREYWETMEPKKKQGQNPATNLTAGTLPGEK